MSYWALATTVPRSPCNSRRDLRAVGTEEVLSMIPMAPLSKFTTAVAVSSTSMSWTWVATRPITDRTGPIMYCSRSMMWMDWVIRQPPPSRALVPRQAAES